MRKVLAFLLCMCAALPSTAASLINDTETEKLLYELISPLAAAADIPQGRMKIHIVNDDDFNAFVAGGEDVYLYTGLLRQIKSTDALQAVVAHELGHTLGGHMAQMSARQDAELKRAMLIQALGVGLMVAGGNPSLGAGVMAGSGGVATQSMLAFSRDEERIADNMGLDLMYRANLNPNGFVTVLQQMGEMTGALESRINPNRVNHPLTTERLNNIRAVIDKRGGDSHATATHTDEYELVRAKLVGYLETPAQVIAKYPTSDTTDAALYARAISRMGAGNLDAARVGTRTLISRHPENPYFYELLGDIEYQFGHYDDSVDAYEQSLKLTTDNAPQIQTALALVLTERNKPDDRARAVDLCRRAILSAPAPLTYWVMSRAYGDSDAGRADWAMAEYYNLIGKTADAHKYALRAQKNLPTTAPEYLKSTDILNTKKK